MDGKVAHSFTRTVEHGGDHASRRDLPRSKAKHKDLPLDGDLVKRIREAEDNKEVVIIVVDPPVGTG